MKNISRQKDDIEPKRYISATNDSFLLDLFRYCCCHLAKSWNGNPFFISFVSASTLELVVSPVPLPFSVVVLHLAGLCSTVVNEAMLPYIYMSYSNIMCADKEFKKITSFTIFYYCYSTSASIYSDHIYECKSLAVDTIDYLQLKPIELNRLAFNNVELPNEHFFRGVAPNCPSLLRTEPAFESTYKYRSLPTLFL